VKKQKSNLANNAVISFAAAAVLCAVFTARCASKKTATEYPPPVRQTLNDRHEALEYDREGFISDSVYRIVIVEPKGESCRNLEAIESAARLRALSSLQKYIVSQGRPIDQNINADLISIIKHNGEFYDTHNSTGRRDIYYYDIKKNNLREYIIRISKTR